MVSSKHPCGMGPNWPPRPVLGGGNPVDCARSHGKRVDCAPRTGVGRGRSAPSPPAHTLSTGPQGAPALRACPPAFHPLGPWLETASRSPHGPLMAAISSSKVAWGTRSNSPRRRLLRSGSRPAHLCSMNYPSWWSRKMGGGAKATRVLSFRCRPTSPDASDQSSLGQRSPFFRLCRQAWNLALVSSSSVGNGCFGPPKGTSGN